MCCTTHYDRDQYETFHLGIKVTLTDKQHFRCRCQFNGNRCERQQSGPDLLCDWCREHFGDQAHTEYCFGLTGRPPRSIREGPIRREYYEKAYNLFEKVSRRYGP